MVLYSPTPPDPFICSPLWDGLNCSIWDLTAFQQRLKRSPSFFPSPFSIIFFVPIWHYAGMGLLYMIDSFGNANEILSTLFNLHFSYSGKNRICNDVTQSRKNLMNHTNFHGKINLCFVLGFSGIFWIFGLCFDSPIILSNWAKLSKPILAKEVKSLGKVPRIGNFIGTTSGISWHVSHICKQTQNLSWVTRQKLSCNSVFTWHNPIRKVSAALWLSTKLAATLVLQNGSISAARGRSYSGRTIWTRANKAIFPSFLVISQSRFLILTLCKCHLTVLRP